MPLFCLSHSGLKDKTGCGLGGVKRELGWSWFVVLGSVGVRIFNFDSFFGSFSEFILIVVLFSVILLGSSLRKLLLFAVVSSMLVSIIILLLVL